MMREATYDSIILDLMLPRLNGFEVIREMRCQRPALLSKTIVLTAASTRTLRAFDDEKLVRCVLRKPFDIEAFVSEVLSCCDGQATSASHPA